MAKKLIGIDLGGTSVKMAILTLEGAVQQKWSIPTNVLSDGENIVPDIIASIRHHLSLYQMSTEDFVGIGMGSPGQVNRHEGTVVGAYNLNWHEEQPIRQQIQQALGLPFFIDNDANLAALGERWIGAGANEDNVVFVTLGTGVGGGIVANGRLVHGIAGSAGEIGHMTVDVNGPKCTCGKNGCLETVASATGIVNLARLAAESYAGTATLKQLVDDGHVTAKDIFDLAKAGDDLALRVVDQFAQYLGLACSHLGNALNPSYIVIGGGVSAAGTFLLERVTRYFETYAFPQVRNTTKLRLATLGNDAGIIGAAKLALDGIENIEE